MDSKEKKKKKKKEKETGRISRDHPVIDGRRRGRGETSDTGTGGHSLRDHPSSPFCWFRVRKSCGRQQLSLGRGRRCGDIMSRAGQGERDAHRERGRKRREEEEEEGEEEEERPAEDACCF